MVQLNLLGVVIVGFCVQLGDHKIYRNLDCMYLIPFFVHFRIIPDLENAVKLASTGLPPTKKAKQMESKECSRLEYILPSCINFRRTILTAYFKLCTMLYISQADRTNSVQTVTSSLMETKEIKAYVYHVSSCSNTYPLI